IAAAVLLAVFALAMGINLQRGRSGIDCGCFRGTLRQSLRIELVLRNILLLAAALLCALMPVTGASHWQLLNGLLGGIALFVLLQGINTLWAIGTPFRRGSTRSAWASRSAS
ncbi:MAG: MauE/DoxX family redox-associated membrane protein, partial [Gammaproteobacteria bacterium]